MQTKTKPMMGIKAIIFDFWGTLMDNGTRSPIRQSQRILKVWMPFSEYVVRLEKTLMTRRFSSLGEAFKDVCVAFGILPKKTIIDKLIGVWNKNRLLAKPYPETLNVLKKLRKAGYKTCLVSNTDCFSVEPLLEKYGMNELFDAIIFSYQIGCLKTDPKMFNIALKKLGVKKDEVLMVGDSIESDMAGAENAGIRGILIDRRNKRDYKEKIKDLNELLILLKNENKSSS